jgi:hypothetical protein
MVALAGLQKGANCDSFSQLEWLRLPRATETG